MGLRGLINIFYISNCMLGKVKKLHSSTLCQTVKAADEKKTLCPHPPPHSWKGYTKYREINVSFRFLGAKYKDN